MTEFTPSSLTRLDTTRLAAYRTNLDFYNGSQWQQTSRHRQLVFNYAKVSIDKVLIITDDIALETGVIRIRAKGSDGGHNGLKSINQVLGRQDYPRLRFGVGNAFGKGQQVDFVLGQWTSEDLGIINSKIEKAAEAALAFGTMELGFVMSQFNG